MSQESPLQNTVIPEDVLIVLPVRDSVLFPGVVLPIAITGKLARGRRAGSRAHAAPHRLGSAIRDRCRSRRNCTRVGTIASIVRFVTAADGTHHLIAQGEQRFTRARLRERRSVSWSRASSRIGSPR